MKEWKYITGFAMGSQLSVESGQAGEGSRETGQWSLPQKPVNNPR